MEYEKFECIDFGTEFCPCHLADKGECLICSQLQGKEFCDCKYWDGICIYQEYINNNFKPRKLREIFKVRILEKNIYEESLLKLTVLASHNLVMELLNPGSYIFIKSDEYNNYFDFPISIESSNPNKDTLTFYIEIKGIKTKNILNIKVNQSLLIRGPYFNGIFGIRNIKNTVNEKCLILARGVGIAPSNLVINKLIKQENKIKVLYDIAPFKEDYFNVDLKDKEENKEENVEFIFNRNKFIEKGELSKELKNFIKKQLEEGITFIHCAGPDILIYRLIEFLDSINRKDIKLSCCNNSRLCCGEGICGSCTISFKGDKLKRFCKMQTDPRNIFKGRRFI